MKKLTEKQRIIYMLKGFEPWQLDVYDIQLENNFFGDEPYSLEESVDDLSWEKEKPPTVNRSKQ